MMLVTGGIASGKRTYLKSLGYGDADMSGDVSSDCAVLLDAQELVRGVDSDVALIADEVSRRKQVATVVEVGSGIVPISASERDWRDRAGALARELAVRSDVVVRMVCGVPVALKGELPNGRKKLVMMRHGQTEANERHVYAGTMDVPLTAEGERQARAAGVVGGVERVYVSTLSRARRTAEICFPNAEKVEVPGLEELDFGDFEGRSAAEMEHDGEYRSWVESNCTTVCPHGECRADLVRRVKAALGRILREASVRGDEQIVVVAHGGTVMAAMSAFADADADYFSWQVGNCEGYCTEVSFEGGEPRFSNWERFADLSFMRTADDDADVHDADLPAHSFFTNSACKYFPCHEGVDPADFNCMFCYCPLYALGPDCGGNFTYTEGGRKSCVDCSLPHMRDNGVRLVAAHYDELARLASSGASLQSV
ncbi:MAG: bifunctional adenosylcobinamide kinase/adenosylcobinamide-phosphate guanylyltransferase [Eggerthellaceae bacterium]|nr:bifunctional adenosylcobinamide kinase/adenosylcobinamide-phosphate guanylyltransferase [Eggerthellaceae bacterium]